MCPTPSDFVMNDSALTIRTDVGIRAAQALIEAARAEAQRLGLAISVAVLDSGGQLVAALRMDGAQLCAMPLAIDKAYTAVACGLPTAAWAERTQPGKADWGLNTALGGRLIAFGGGLPVFAATSLVGGVGVSGATAAQDDAIAKAAIKGAGLK